MKKTIFTKAVTVILSLLLILSLFPVSRAEEARPSAHLWHWATRGVRRPAHWRASRTMI